MKKIKIENVKKEDYIKAVLSPKQFKENVKNKLEDLWVITYFKVKTIEYYKEEEITEIGSNVWVDYDNNNHLLRVLNKEHSIDGKDVTIYKLTEEEFAKAVGKHLIVNFLENGKDRKEN